MAGLSALAAGDAFIVYKSFIVGLADERRPLQGPNSRLMGGLAPPSTRALCKTLPQHCFTTNYEIVLVIYYVYRQNKYEESKGIEILRGKCNDRNSVTAKVSRAAFFIFYYKSM